MSEISEAFLIRAAAHSRGTTTLPTAKRWRNGVSDLDVTCTFLAMEGMGVRFTQSATGRWLPPTGQAGGVLAGVDTSVTIREMIRTGLVRTVGPAGMGQTVIPSKVHYRNIEDRSMTACLDPVEGMREGRVRTVDDLALVDCLECEAAVAAGGPRGL